MHRTECFTLTVGNLAHPFPQVFDVEDAFVDGLVLSPRNLPIHRPQVEYRLCFPAVFSHCLPRKVVDLSKETFHHFVLGVQHERGDHAPGEAAEEPQFLLPCHILLMLDDADAILALRGAFAAPPGVLLGRLVLLVIVLGGARGSYG